MKDKRSAIKAVLDNGGFEFLVVVLSLMGVVLLVDWAPWTSDFTLYPVKCRDGATPIVDCGFFDRAPMNRTRYKVDAEHSQVLFRFSGMRGYSLDRAGFVSLADCRITDRENWECPFGEGGGKIIFRNREVIRTGVPPHGGYVGYFEWWLLLIKAKVS